MNPYFRVMLERIKNGTENEAKKREEIMLHVPDVLKAKVKKMTSEEIIEHLCNGASLEEDRPPENIEEK